METCWRGTHRRGRAPLPRAARKTTTYPIEDGEQAYADMHAGKIIGRAVLVP
jgi:hypothetical protein